MKGRWGLDQGKIAWQDMLSYTLSVPNRYPPRLDKREKAALCVCLHACAYLSACVCVAMRFEIPVLIQDPNSSDSVINIMHRSVIETHARTHPNTQIAAEPLETTIQMCLGNCFTLGGNISLSLSFRQTRRHTCRPYYSSWKCSLFFFEIFF